MSQFKDMGKKPPAIEITRTENGEMILTSPYLPQKPPQSIIEVFHNRVKLHPERMWLAARSDDGVWSGPDYQTSFAICRKVAQALLNFGIGPEDNIAILSPRSFEHFQMSYGAMMATVPVAPLGAPYSLLSVDHAKLKHIVGLLRPRLLLIDDWSHYESAIKSLFKAKLIDESIRIVICRGDIPDKPWLLSFDELIDVEVTPAVDDSIGSLTHANVAKYMFTSGSTGMPKAVIYTQSMMCHSLANPAGLTRSTALSTGNIPDGSRILEWMPWSHTGAGVMRLNQVLASGGTIYFDTGRPLPGEYQETIRNIREVSPTAMFGAPVGYAMLVDALEQDDALNSLVFNSVKSLGFGSAAMSPALYDRLQVLSVKATGERIGITSGLASTEVIGCCTVYWPMEGTGTIGLPIPGVEIKLAPNADKLEIRVKGSTVTPGYYRDEEKTRASFDSDGFFLMGDAVRFVDENNPVAGLAFDGRIAEEFKLMTGTWVSAGTLRTRIVSATSPYVRDVVICGLNQSYVAVLLWPNPAGCIELVDDVSPTLASLASARSVQQAIAERLRRYNQDNPGSSTRIARFLLLAEPPSLDAGEITEKGYLNQRASLKHHASEVEELFSDIPTAEVVVL